MASGHDALLLGHTAYGKACGAVPLKSPQILVCLSLHTLSWEERPRLESEITDTLVDDIHWTPGASNPHCECAGQEKGKEEVPATGDWPPPSLSSSCSTPTDEKEEMVITSTEFISPRFSCLHNCKIANDKVDIQATDIALGLRRVPAGFNAMVPCSGLEWRTENKRSSVNDDVVGWSGQIAFVSLSTNDGDVVSPCSSIFVTVKRPKCEESPSARRLGPHCSITEPKDELEDATNQDHCTLSRYRKYGGKRDLERSNERSVFGSTHRDAINLIPHDHLDKPSHLNNFGISFKARFQRLGELSDLEDAIPIYGDSVERVPLNPRSNFLHNY
ncbi:hypothetical protein EV363DRAFT_1394374 [Boletus edulis]|nr:hypothetical protein EV363DRAFT_1394374 [Boletus edulis]